MSTAHRIVFVLAAILGGSGIAAAAASSHTGADVLGSYSLIALTHAPVLLTLILLSKTTLLRIATLTLAAGATLFCADLAARHLFGGGVFPFAAPLGGMAMIVGWVLVGVGGLLSPRA